MDIENIKKSLPDFLVGWLKKEGVYDKYIANIEKQLGYSFNFPDAIKDNCGWIIYAFNWGKTVEGFDFWYAINDKLKGERPWITEESDYVKHVKEVMPSWFKEWLTDNGAYDKYMVNIKSLPAFDSIFPDLISPLLHRWISSAFLWRSTEEGNDFWSSMCEKLKKDKPWEKKLAPKDSLDDVRKAISSKISRELKAFLIENGAFDKFIENIRLFRYGKPIETIADANNTMNGCDQTISGAFVWSETPEGQAFWSGLDCKYSKMSDYTKSIREVIKENLPDELKEFLKSNGILDKFVENFRLYKCSGELTDLTIAKSKARVCDRIGAAFTWRDTPEGVSYWDKLDKEYCEKLAKDKEEENKSIFYKLPEWFIRWLESKGILEKYKDNMLNHPMRFPVDISYPGGFIDCAFIWVDTPEGDVFWMGINNEYREEEPWENSDTTSPACGDSSCPTLETDDASQKELPPSDQFIPKLPYMDTSKFNIKLF